MQEKEVEARAALNRGEIELAQTICEQWRQESPANAEACNLAGVVALLKDDLPNALSLFERATELDAANAKAWSNLGAAGRKAGWEGHRVATCFRKALGANQENDDIRYNLALALHDQGENGEALVVLAPMFRDGRLSDKSGWLQASVLHKLGRLDEARQLMARLAEHYPLRPEFRRALGDLANECQDFAQAEQAYRQANDLAPDDSDTWRGLGNLLLKLGRPQEAIKFLRAAAERAPDDRNIQMDYVSALRMMGAFIDARALLERARVQWPDFDEVYLYLAMIDGEHGNRDLAEQEVRHALALNPDSPFSHNYLGILMDKKGLREEAEACYRQALKLDERLPEPYSNLGNVLAGRLCLKEAEHCYLKAIELNPHGPEARHNLGLLQLVSGRYEEGWRNYEWRWKSLDMREHVRAFSQPEWRGEPLRGKRILVHAEQGMGDAIQFARYMPLLKETGAEVLFEVPHSLKRLISSGAGIDRLLSRNDPLPEFDCHVPLLSLPGLLGTRKETIPAVIPYLGAAAADRNKWRAKLDTLGPGLRVGIAWSGNPKHINDRARSIPFGNLGALFRIGGVQWISLQKGKAGPNAVQWQDEDHISWIDWTDSLADYADTAALIEELDLVIAVDTSVAHLAGALGKAVWILLPFAPDWRWLLELPSTPWYPSARLYRQKQVGNWQGVLATVGDDLAGLVGKR